MKQHIAYTDFLTYVHGNFADRISLEELNDLLHLEEDYNKDSASSIGKALTMRRLKFTGSKLGGVPYEYDRSFFDGINVWIADNHKGKSTIFKIIKFSLTGVDKIKADIRPWIDEIILEFAVGKNVYTIFVDRRGRDRGGLYCMTMVRFLELRELQKLDTIDNQTEFQFRNRSQFEEKIQAFFFEQLSFYSLKYTKRDPSREKIDFVTTGLTWNTYFKSIYLESTDYGYLFFDEEGFNAQGRKILEMVLGLPLTYPINALTLQRDKIVEQIAKIKTAEKTTSEKVSSAKEDLQARHAEVKKKLEDARRAGKITFDESELVKEYNRIQFDVNELRRKQRITNQKHEAQKSNLEHLEQKIYELSEDRGKIVTEIARLDKQRINLDVYSATESFFSSLEVVSCPHCETDVTPERRQHEHENRTCSLCGNIPNVKRVTEDEIAERHQKIKDQQEGHNRKAQEIAEVLTKLQESIPAVRSSATQFYSELLALPAIEAEERRLNELEIRIKEVVKEREERRELMQHREDLIRQEAVLRFQLETMEKRPVGEFEELLSALNLRREIIEFALTALAKRRANLNKKILSKFQDLILNEVNAFGLVSISDVKINDRFSLELIQNNVVVGFSDLEPGEKLRIKLAFYLSLIQLDIEHSLGRHPRFLIFDSPGSEEMVPKHLHGLAEIFKNVNERFKDHLQIFVGSALRDFAAISEPERTFVGTEDEFVF